MAKSDPDVHELFGQLLARIEGVRMELHDALAEREEEPEEKPNADDVMGLITAASAIEGRFRQSEEAVARMLEPLRLSLEKVAARLEQDAERDARVARTNEQLVTALAEFTSVMRTPLRRTGQVDTPAGPLKMTITESRGH